MRRPRRAAGFTLVEVMIALAILAGGLVIFIHSTASNIAAAQRAEMLGAATELARSKMYDIEEMLLEEGFQQLDKSLRGDFSDEGWPKIEWQADIDKIELPNLGALGALSGDEGEEGEGGGGGLLGSMLGGFGGGLDPGAAAGGSIIASQFEIIRNLLEESIRKVTVTVTWKVGGHDEELVVSCYFTDPAAVNRIIPTFGGGGGGGAGGDGGGAGGPSTGPSGGQPGRGGGQPGGGRGGLPGR